jgi:hypothetical protein
MISLLADVTRHLTILAFIVQFEFSLSCQCYLRAMPRWRYRFFCLYMMAYKQHQESCCQCSKSSVDVRGAPSNPSNARPFEQEMRGLNRQNGGCVHLQKLDSSFGFFCAGPPTFTLVLFVGIACARGPVFPGARFFLFSAFSASSTFRFASLS